MYFYTFAFMYCSISGSKLSHCSTKVEKLRRGIDCLFCSWYVLQRIKKTPYGHFNSVKNLIFIGGGL